ASAIRSFSGSVKKRGGCLLRFSPAMSPASARAAAAGHSAAAGKSPSPTTAKTSAAKSAATKSTAPPSIIIPPASVPRTRHENPAARHFGHDDNEEDKKKDHRPGAPAASGILFRKRLVFTTRGFFDRQDRFFNSTRRVARTKLGCQLVADDLRTSGIG